MSTNPIDTAKNITTKATDQVKEKVAEGGNKIVNTAHEQRPKAAGTLEAAADAVDREGRQLSKSLDEYASDVKNGLNEAADYVRKHDASEIVNDAVQSAREYPLVSLLMIGAAVLGGGFLLAGMLSQGETGETSGRDTAQSNSLFALASSGLGPKAGETATRIRDAAFNMALTKAIDSIEDMFPGFREHFEKA